MGSELSRRDFLRGAAVLGAGVVLLPRLARATGDAPDGEWLVGDIHCHTVLSHDVWGGPDDDNTGLDEVYTFGWTPGEQIAIATARGLDFLAITDHNDVRALSDPAYAAAGITMIRGYEHSLSRGHAGCLGIDKFYENLDTSTDAGAMLLRDKVHAEGGIFILNHPFYGSGWRYSETVRPDSIEVWNIGWPYRHIESTGQPSSPSVSDNYKSLPYWESSFLATGKMPATGGSDNHYRATTAVQGVGQPTTWVYATANTPAAILDGIRNGRTMVSAEPPLMGGIKIELTARSGSSTWMVGDTVPSTAGSVTVSARVLNAPAHSLVFVVDGTARPAVSVALPDQTAEITLDAASTNRVRVQVHANEGYWMGALTSPIYFG